MRWQRHGWLSFALLLALSASWAQSDAAPADADPEDVLRVGTSGDYAPFSTASAEEGVDYDGFDIAVARAYAADRGLELRLVQFAWPELSSSLASDRFDLAMSGVTIRPERSALGRFSVTVAETGAVVLGRPKGRFREIDEFNRRPIRIGVNAGGHLEQVATLQFARAVLIAIPDNAAVRAALLSGSVDAAVTDTMEAPRWLEGTHDVDLIGPFTTDRKAYLVRADRPELSIDLDTWLIDREADGTLQALRLQYFGPKSSNPYTPLDSLLAAIDERLALMPWVAVAKRRSGMPLEAPEREEVVLDAAVESARAAAESTGRPLPDAKLVRALFRAQMEAAKEVQWNSIQDPDYVRPTVVPDVKTELRPALLRIGDRIGQLLVRIPAGLEADSVRDAAQSQLRVPRLSEASQRAIADAIVAISNAVGAREAAAQRTAPPN